MEDLIINLIQQLQIAGYSKEQIAAAYNCSINTIRRYQAGLCPAAKQQQFIHFVKTNYKEVYDYVAEQKK